MNRDVIKAVGRLLAGRQSFALATIISHQGSTPRLPGTKMVICRGGEIFGTVGGGMLESAVCQRAARVLETATPRRMVFELTTRARETMDMICGGWAEVLVDLVDPDAASGQCLAQWQQMQAHERRGILVTLLDAGSQPVEAVHTHHLVLDADGGLLCGHPPPDLPLSDLAAAGTGQALVKINAGDGRQAVIEPFHPCESLFIFGAGHVSRPTARMASMVGFRVEVFDDRAEFASPDRFPDAHRVVVLDDYDGALTGLPVAADSFIVVVTRGHLHDQTVLAQALGTPAAYIGMIGSRTKRDTIYNNLRLEGFGDTDLARVASPIGLSIGAQTPEEIAVSIVAELIQRRREVRS
jgi:xanthine dehydrogenase accessory factor